MNPVDMSVSHNARWSGQMKVSVGFKGYYRHTTNALMSIKTTLHPPKRDFSNSTNHLYTVGVQAD